MFLLFRFLFRTNMSAENATLHDMVTGDWSFLDTIEAWPLSHTFLPFFFYVLSHEAWMTMACVFFNEFFELLVYNLEGSYVIFPQEGTHSL